MIKRKELDISRILFNGELSIWDVCYQTPHAVHLKRDRKKTNLLPLRPCSQPGFTEPVPHDTAGALLPQNLCTLTSLSYQFSVISN